MDEPGAESIELYAQRIALIKPARYSESLIPRRIHSNPETCFEEFQAHDSIVNFLNNAGIPRTPQAFGLKTSFLAEYGKGGRVVTFCAEYDALPQIGHGCGHNVIAVSSIAAFLDVVAALKVSPVAGRARILGCPAEEGGGRKIKLIHAGAFADVDAALMPPPIPLAESLREIAGISYGACLSSCRLEASFMGKSAHATSMPWAGINALDAASLSYTAIGLLRQHIKPGDRINIVMPEGGTAHNVIPEQSRIQCSVRFETLAWMEFLKSRVESCFEGAATATGCALDLTMPVEPYADLRPKKSICAEFSRFTGIFGQSFLCDFQIGHRDAFGTDMGNVSYHTPSFQGSFCIPTRPGVALHTQDFRDAAKTDEAHNIALHIGQGMAAVGLRILKDNKFAASVKNDFEDDKKLR